MNGAALSAVDEDRETRQLQFLKNLEMLLGDSDVGDEGVSDSFKWIGF